MMAPPARRWLWGLFTLVLFLGLGWAGYRWATTEALATLTQFSGGTERDVAASQAEWFQAELDDEFYDGDGAKTHPQALAHFRLTPGAKLTLRPASQIRFRKRQHGRGSVGLTVEVGEADVSTKDETFTIDSQFGTLVIERNSLIRLRRDGSTMRVQVELGSLLLGDPSGNGKSLKAGQAVVLEMGGVVLDDVEPEKAPESEAVELPEDEFAHLERGDGVDHAELVVPAGQTFVVHDPSPPTAVGFTFATLCEGPARVALGKLRTEAARQGNLSVPPGVHEYQVECLGEPNSKTAQGQIRVLRDSGVRPLPTFTPTAEVAADGRKYTVMYQQRLPQVTVTWPGAPRATGYTLIVDGRELTAKSPRYTLKSGVLQPGAHQVIFQAHTEPMRQSRTTGIQVSYDIQAPAARVAEPPNGFQPGENVPIEGQALPGWSVSMEGKELELDGTRRFSQTVASEDTLVVTFSHPKHGIHYYLRRPRAQTP